MRFGLLALLAFPLATACATSTGNYLGPAPQPASGRSVAPSARQCDDVVRAGAPVTDALVIDGCQDKGRSVTLTPTRCRDGRIYLSHEADLKGFVHRIWQPVGPGHEATAKSFKSC